VRVEPKTIGIAAVMQNPFATLRDPRRLNDKLTLLSEVRQARPIRGHFLLCTFWNIDWKMVFLGILTIQCKFRCNRIK